VKSLSADFNLNALNDTHDHSCFLARLGDYWHLMTQWPPARRKVYDSGPQPACTTTVVNVQPCQAQSAAGRDVIRVISDCDPSAERAENKCNIWVIGIWVLFPSLG
jgi:hypothetical protein